MFLITFTYVITDNDSTRKRKRTISPLGRQVRRRVSATDQRKISQRRSLRLVLNVNAELLIPEGYDMSRRAVVKMPKLDEKFNLDFSKLKASPKQTTGN